MEKLERLIGAAQRLNDASRRVTDAEFLGRFKSLNLPRELQKDMRGKPSPDVPREGMREQYSEALREVLTVLGGISLTPIFLGTIGGRLIVDWTAAGLKGSAAGSFFNLIELWRLNLVGDLKRCVHCNGWFFAAPSWQRFDSKKCQQAAFEARPGRKEQRAAWARQHYHAHVKGEK
jgi:hypothetical protein